MNDTALPAKTKELIALGIAINLRCESCMLLHIANALKLGVTHKEIYDTVGVSILSGGGAAIAMSIKALEMLDVSKEQLVELSTEDVKL
jgi:AhpD family alkylhydroperoxidase